MYLAASHALADDLGMFVDPHVGSSRKQTLAHLAQHNKISLATTNIN